MDMNVVGSGKLTKTDHVSIELSRTFAVNLKSFTLRIRTLYSLLPFVCLNCI
jgi:hypothetical protein